VQFVVRVASDSFWSESRSLLFLHLAYSESDYESASLAIPGLCFSS
jgi:hypothetical protein